MSFVLLSLFLLLAASAHAQNSTQAGRFTVEHPTLHNLGFEWTINAGVRIPTVNDDFSGDAPDLGALEVGQPEPHYGPRWLKRQPFYR